MSTANAPDSGQPPLMTDLPEPLGRLDLMALDCPDAPGLASFYQQLLGGTLKPTESGTWVELHTETGIIACQQVDNHRRPTWPTGEVPQQGHIDIDVVDLDIAEVAALERGAVKAETQPSPEHFRVFIDPAGHPFCLVDVRYS